MFQNIGKHQTLENIDMLKSCKNPSIILLLNKDKTLQFEQVSPYFTQEEKEILASYVEKFALKSNGAECFYLPGFETRQHKLNVIILPSEPKEKHLPWERVGKNLAQNVKRYQVEGLLFESKFEHNVLKALWNGYYASNKQDLRYKSKPQTQVNSAVFYGDQSTTDAMNLHLIEIEAMLSAKFFGNAPGNILTTTAFAKEAEKLAGGEMKVRILERTALEKENMHLLLAVGNSSEHPPYLAVMEWVPEGTEKQKPLALVGKGVCFDTGGVNLKPSSALLGMKHDMCGAAAVIATMEACKKLNIKKRVIGVLALVENALSDKAMRPDDILTSRSGKTVSILNTDAEGRLILGDAVDYTIDKYQPETLIDLATLTGACVVALGSAYAGLFSNDDQLAENLYKSGLKTNEKVWRLPLGKEYSDMIINDLSDIQNVGMPMREAGSITAAVFIEAFIKDGVKWAHLDIAGTAMPEKHPIHSKGASGYGPMLLLEYIKSQID